MSRKYVALQGASRYWCVELVVICMYRNLDNEVILSFCFQEVSPVNFEDQSYNETSRG
jgi:hypothetical protein